jgi:hypothetical protein
VPEAKAAGRVGRVHEAGGEQGIESGEGAALVHAGGRRREVDLERLAGHGAACEQAALLGRERRQLALDRGDHGGRHLGVGTGGARTCGTRRLRAAAGELFEEVRVAAALAHQLSARAGGEPGAQQLVRLGRRERLEVEQVAAAVAAGPVHGGGQQPL